MNLIKKANKNIIRPAKRPIEEDAAGGAVGAGAIAAYPRPLLRDMISRVRRKRAKKSAHKKSNQFEMLSVLSSVSTIKEDQTFDQTEVVARMKSLEQKERVYTHDTVQFGLKDDREQITLVTIPREQADSFEEAISAYLAKEDRGGNIPEIAEILYKLKDRFDIVNVQMPDVEEDQEEILDIPPNKEEGGKVTALDRESLSADDEIGDMVANTDASRPSTEDTDDAKGLLNKVIDLLMKSEDAKKADAEARKQEAKVKQTKVDRQSLDDLVRREEQIQDMEASEKFRKAQEKEITTLAKLARYKRDKEEEGELEIPPQNKLPEDLGVSDIDINREEEESTAVKSINTGKVSTSDLATIILQRIRQQ